MMANDGRVGSSADTVQWTSSLFLFRFKSWPIWLDVIKPAGSIQHNWNNWWSSRRSLLPETAENRSLQSAGCKHDPTTKGRKVTLGGVREENKPSLRIDVCCRPIRRWRPLRFRPGHLPSQLSPERKWPEGLVQRSVFALLFEQEAQRQMDGK